MASKGLNVRLRSGSVIDVTQVVRTCVLSLICLCMGCHSPDVMVFDPDPTLPTHVGGASEVKMLSLQKLLQQHGVRVISMGQNYMLSIPSVILFHDKSPALKWSAYGVLNDKK